MAKSNPLAVDNAGPPASTAASPSPSPGPSPEGDGTMPSKATGDTVCLSPACDDYYRQGVMMLTGNYLAILSTNRRDVDLDATMAGIRESWRKQTAMAGFVTPEGVQVQVISNK